MARTFSGGRVRGIVAALVTAMLLTAGVAAARPAGSEADPPGTVVRVDPLPRQWWLPGASAASVLTYRTTGPRGVPALSTGAVFVPSGAAPTGGWPVVSWGHGAVGIADRCAPTVDGRIDNGYLAHWLAQGYAVVATDYPGLGSPGLHAYLDGPSEAHALIDMVRAARAVEPSLGSRWVALGQSQGGQAAMVAASLATRYAPELDYRGAVALGVPSNIEHLVPFGDPRLPPLPLTGTTVFIAYLLAGMRATRPDVDVDRFLSPRGREVLARLEDLCYQEAAAEVGDLSIGDLLARRTDDPALVRAACDMLEIPTRGYDRPLFLGQGLTDTVTPAPFTFKLVADLTAAGERFVFRSYPVGHLETMRASLDDVTAFVEDLFAAGR